MRLCHSVLLTWFVSPLKQVLLGTQVRGQVTLKSWGTHAEIQMEAHAHIYIQSRPFWPEVSSKAWFILLPFSGGTGAPDAARDETQIFCFASVSSLCVLLWPNIHERIISWSKPIRERILAGLCLWLAVVLFTHGSKLCVFKKPATWAPEQTNCCRPAMRLRHDVRS